MENELESKYGSRKFILAACTLGFGSALIAVIVAFNLPAGVVLMPGLWWWAGIATSVLALYGGSSIIDKKLNPREGGGV